MRRLSFFAVLLIGIASEQVIAQNSTPATPQHPIDTRPEGQANTCSYTVGRSEGQTRGSSSCATDAGQGSSAAKRFPYPVEPEEKAQQAQPQNSSQSQQEQSPSKRFPYPGDSSDQQNSPLKDAGSTGESSSSSSSSGDSGLPSDDTGNAPEALPAPKRERKKLPPVPRQTPDEREQEDVKIAAFYQNDGNYRAAYMRAKDAVGLADDDPEAHFALAEAARKLGKFDEAQKSYKRCLELDPVPKLRKGSEKALKEMAGS